MIDKFMDWMVDYGVPGLILIVVAALLGFAILFPFACIENNKQARPCALECKDEGKFPYRSGGVCFCADQPVPKERSSTRTRVGVTSKGDVVVVP